MTKWYDHAFGDWYSRLYPHRDLAEASRAVQAIRRWLPGNGLLLDAACGEGRHLRILNEAGYTALGIDRSWTLLRAGRKTPGLEQRLIRADMRTLPFSSGTFAAVLSMFTSFGYFGSEAVHAGFLVELARVSREKGVLILDYLNPPRVRKTLVPSSLRTVEGHEVVETRSIVRRGEEELVVKEIQIKNGRGNQTASFREEVSLYDRPRLLALLHRAGWRTLDVRGDYQNNDWSEESDRMIVIAEKEPSP